MAQWRPEDRVGTEVAPNNPGYGPESVMNGQNPNIGLAMFKKDWLNEGHSGNRRKPGIGLVCAGFSTGSLAPQARRLSSTSSASQALISD